MGPQSDGLPLGHGSSEFGKLSLLYFNQFSEMMYLRLLVALNVHFQFQDNE